MARYNSNSNQVEKNNRELTPNQEEAIEKLKAERDLYVQQLLTTTNKRNQIKNILDNFEQVIVGNIIVRILPDENSEEILNSVIIPRQEIEAAIELAEVSSDEKSSARSVLNDVFNTPIVNELIARSSELSGEELYSIIYYKVIGSFEFKPGIDLLVTIIEYIETNT